MYNWLRKLFISPEFPDEQATRLARQLNSIFIVSIVFFIGCDILLAITGYPLANLAYWIFLSLAVIITILLVVMRHGFLRQTATLYLSIGFLGLLSIAWTQTGVRDTTFVGLTAIILLAGVLMGSRGLVVFTVLSALGGFALAFGQNAGLIAHPLDTPVNTAIFMAGVFVIDAIFAYMALSNLNASVKRSQASESNLLASNNELTALRASLEKQVEERTAELTNANERSRSRAKKFEAVAEVARVTTVRRDPAQLLPEITSLIAEYFGYYHVGIYLLEENDRYAVLRASNSPGGKQMIAKKYHVDLAEGNPTSLAISQGKTQVALTDEFYYPDLPDTRSEAILPLKVGERITGALDIHSQVPNAFPEEDIEILNILADQVAIIIEDSHLLSETTQALAEARTTYGQYLRQAWVQMPKEMNLAGFRYTDGESTPIENPIALPDIQSALQSGEAVASTAKASSVAIPLKLRDQVIGVLNVRSNTSINWTESQITLVRAIAERVSLALENARLFEETTRRADRERTVTEISTHIRSVSDPQIMLQTALEELKRALGASDIQIRPYSRPSADKNAG